MDGEGVSPLSHNAALGGNQLELCKDARTPGERRSLESRSQSWRGLSQETDHRVYSAGSVDAEFSSETHKH